MSSEIYFLTAWDARGSKFKSYRPDQNSLHKARAERSGLCCFYTLYLIALRAPAHLAISSSIAEADPVWWSPASKFRLSSSNSHGICTITPSTIGIIFTVVTNCLAICADRRPP